MINFTFFPLPDLFPPLTFFKKRRRKRFRNRSTIDVRYPHFPKESHLRHERNENCSKKLQSFKKAFCLLRRFYLRAALIISLEINSWMWKLMFLFLSKISLFNAELYSITVWPILFSDLNQQFLFHTCRAMRKWKKEQKKGG